MDLQTIASRTGLPIRTVRYVLDNRLLPGTRVVGQPNALGRARHLLDDEGFAVACAAKMLQSGIKKETVIKFMDALCSFVWEKRHGFRVPSTAIVKAFEQSASPAIAMFGDGANLRLTIGDRDTKWMQPGTWARLADDYEPRVVIRIDLGQMRDEVLSRR
jgi:hypothetical protein